MDDQQNTNQNQPDAAAKPSALSEPKPAAKPRGFAGKLWHKWVRPIIIVLVVTCSLRSAVADWNDVPTGSMNPTILEGDRIFVNKLAYDLKVPFTTMRLATWGAPQRGDIVVFDSPKDGTRLVKRVIGLPGDTVELRNERLFINGQEAPMSLTAAGKIMSGQEDLDGRTHRVQVLPYQPAMRSFGPLKVPDGCYWMMGDNRDNSADSRFFGPVPAKLIMGRASAVAISVDPADHYMPRWERFFKSLDK